MHFKYVRSVLRKVYEPEWSMKDIMWNIVIYLSSIVVNFYCER